MISVTDLRLGTVYEENGSSSAKATEDKQYFLVLSYEHIKMGRGSGNVKVKVRNLESGSTLEKSYITGARVQGANLDRKKVQYLYKDERQIHVMDTTSFEQFALDMRLVSDIAKFLKEGLEITLFSVHEKPLYLEIPKILDYKVTQTGGSARGTSVGAVYKDATLESGLVVKVPLFIKNGETIRVDTRSGEYVERAK